MTRNKPKTGDKCAKSDGKNPSVDNKGNNINMNNESSVNHSAQGINSVNVMNGSNGVNQGGNSATNMNVHPNTQFIDPNFYLPPMMNPNTPQQMHYQMSNSQSFDNRGFTPAGPQISIAQPSIAHPGIAQPNNGQSNMASPANNDYQTNVLINMINKLDARLQNIETNVNNLNKIQKEISVIHCDVTELKHDNSSLKHKMAEVETFCQTVSDITDDFCDHKQNCSASMCEIQNENKHLRDKVSALETQNNEIRDKMLDLQCRSMRENLLFTGINESNDPTPEDCESVLRSFLNEHVQNDPSVNTDGNIHIGDIEFDRVHRLGGPYSRKPRPIVAKFTDYKQREVIRNAGVNLNKQKKTHYINEQYPPEIEERRKILFPILRKLKANKTNRCNLVRDKLYLNGMVYNPHTDMFVNPRRQPQSRVPDMRQNFPSKRPAYTDNMQQVPTFSIPRRHVHNQGQRLDFTTPNKYNALNSENSGPVNRNKQKARSPLDDTQVKRPHVDLTNTECQPAESVNCLISAASNPPQQDSSPKLVSPQSGPQSESPLHTKDTSMDYTVNESTHSTT